MNIPEEWQLFASANQGQATNVTPESTAKFDNAIVAGAEGNAGVGRVLSHALFGDGKVVPPRATSSPTREKTALALTTPSPPGKHSVDVSAPVPFNPISEDWQQSSPLERELAWVTEESTLLLLSSRGIKDYPIIHLPLVLDFAWENGSQQLRESLMTQFSSEVTSMLKISNGKTGKLMVVDAYVLVLQESLSSFDSCHQERFDLLREEARAALTLGYCRSDSIGQRLGLALGPNRKKKRRVHRKKNTKRLGNGDVVVGGKLSSNVKSTNNAVSSLTSVTTTTEMDIVASTVPCELNPLEEELAWLVGESLLAEDSLVSMPPTSKQTELVVSSGPTQPNEINWSYCTSRASQPLKKLLASSRRRPLQRVVRSHDSAVRIAFAKRREEIFSLLLEGYRRAEVQAVLPSHESLVGSGYLEILTLRHMRYKKYSGSILEAADSKALRSACNQRLSDISNSPRKRKASRKKKAPPQCNKKLQFSV